MIPNFLDCAVHRRRDVRAAARAAGARPAQKVLIHVSNFRPVKRVDGSGRDLRASPRDQVPARLLMVGDGPDLAERAARLARSLAVADDVQFLGEQDQVVPLLSIADVFLLPSAQESFGLAALEAMACEVPVVASRIGGLPEVIEHGVSGFLHEPDDLAGMARSAVRLLTDDALHCRAAEAACRAARRALLRLDDRPAVRGLLRRDPRALDIF